MNKDFLILSEMFRTKDKDIIKNIKKIELDHSIKFNTIERKKLDFMHTNTMT